LLTFLLSGEKIIYEKSLNIQNIQFWVVVPC